MSVYSQDTEVRLNQLMEIGKERPFTKDEMKEIVSLVRDDRVSASYASKGAKSTAAAKKVTPEEALAKLKQGLLGLAKKS